MPVQCGQSVLHPFPLVPAEGTVLTRMPSVLKGQSCVLALDGSPPENRHLPAQLALCSVWLRDVQTRKLSELLGRWPESQGGPFPFLASSRSKSIPPLISLPAWSPGDCIFTLLPLNPSFPSEIRLCRHPKPAPAPLSSYCQAPWHLHFFPSSMPLF